MTGRMGGRGFGNLYLLLFFDFLWLWSNSGISSLIFVKAFFVLFYLHQVVRY